jgi:hypothetical protein
MELKLKEVRSAGSRRRGVSAGGMAAPRGAWYRNAFSHVPRGKMRGNRGDAQGDPRAAEPARRADEGCRGGAELKCMKLGKLVEWMATTVAETLAYALGESVLALAITTATELVHPKGCDCTNVCSETLLPR